MRLLILTVVCACAVSSVAGQVPPRAAAGPASARSAATAIRFGEVRLRTGVRLHYAEAGEPAGTPVVLLHGLADSWFSFSRILPELPRDWRIVALDQRGHGDSDRPASGYTVADFAEDVLALLDTLEIPQAVLVGHSMGAFVAQRVAIIAPDRVRHLVLIDGAPSARSPALLGLRDELAVLPPRMPDDYLRSFQYGTVHGSVPAEFMNRVIAESAKVPTRVALGALDGLLAAGDSTQLGAIRAPTLLLWGDRDGIFDGRAQRLYQQSIPTVELRAYADVGHAPHWEDPQRVARDVRAFVARAVRR